MLRPGDTVRFTAAWLRSAGSVTERMAPYTVLECSCCFCKRGEHVAVDDPNDTTYFTADELKADPTLQWRHINRGNLKKARF